MTHHVPASTRTWHEGERTGVSFAVMRRHHQDQRGGLTLITRFSCGVAGGWHTHPGGEELYVIRGRCLLNDVELAMGDYVYTSAGESHELVALEETEVLVILPQLPIYAERA